MKKSLCDRITKTTAHGWLAQIVAGAKKIEYRRIKPYRTTVGEGLVAYPSR